jgi:hypothetical protein
MTIAEGSQKYGLSADIRAIMSGPACCRASTAIMVLAAAHAAAAQHASRRMIWRSIALLPLDKEAVRQKQGTVNRQALLKAVH